MLDNFNFVPQGWECPKCGRVYAPSSPMCWFCPTQTTTTTNIPGMTAGTDNTLTVSSCEFKPLNDGRVGSSEVCAKCGRHKIQHAKITNT